MEHFLHNAALKNCQQPISQCESELGLRCIQCGEIILSMLGIGLFSLTEQLAV